MSGFNPTPSQADFQTFLTNVVGIAVEYLPVGSPSIGYAYSYAYSVVLPLLAYIPGNLYSLAIYNLAADALINYAQDQPGRSFFSDLRKSLGISIFVPGVTGSSSDGGTSNSRVTPDFMEGLTMMDLQNMKTPYGRQYLAIAQQYGSIWGLS